MLEIKAHLFTNLFLPQINYDCFVILGYCCFLGVGGGGGRGVHHCHSNCFCLNWRNVISAQNKVLDKAYLQKMGQLSNETNKCPL